MARAGSPALVLHRIAIGHRKLEREAHAELAPERGMMAGIVAVSRRKRVIGIHREAMAHALAIGEIQPWERERPMDCLFVPTQAEIQGQARSSFPIMLEVKAELVATSKYGLPFASIIPVIKPGVENP